MTSLVRASGDGGVVEPQKKCFGFVSPESAGAAGDAPKTPSAASTAASATTARTQRANERADLTGLPPLVDARVPRRTRKRLTPKHRNRIGYVRLRERGDRRLRRLGLLLVPRHGRGARGRHAVRDALGALRRRRSRGSKPRVLSATRPPARASAPRDPVPRQRLGYARPGSPVDRRP